MKKKWIQYNFWYNILKITIKLPGPLDDFNATITSMQSWDWTWFWTFKLSLWLSDCILMEDRYCAYQNNLHFLKCIFASIIYTYKLTNLGINFEPLVTEFLLPPSILLHIWDKVRKLSYKLPLLVNIVKIIKNLLSFSINYLEIANMRANLSQFFVWNDYLMIIRYVENPFFIEVIFFS